MTVLDEERCRELVGKLCSGLGWEVRPEPGMPHVLFTGEGRWIAFGGTWKSLYESFCESAYWFASAYGVACPFVGGIPRWARLCSSPEELALKIEALL